MSELSKKISEGDNLHRLNHFSIVHPEIKLNKKMMDVASITDRSEQIEEIDTSTMSKEKTKESISVQFSKPSDYLSKIKEYMPKEIISDENYQEILNVANYFNNDVTSFIILESRLNLNDAKSDYCFAVSSRNGEREVLKDLLRNGNLPYSLLDKPSWKHLREFTDSWANPKSILYENIIGLWFEFDTAYNVIDDYEPSIFFQPKSDSVITGDIHSQNIWITKIALPTLLGKPLSNKVETKVLDCIKKLPMDASVFQIGTMLSRKNDDIRLLINRIDAEEIIPYLESIGWKDDGYNRLSNIIEEIKDLASRIVLHISVWTEVNPKVGIECSFYPNSYHKETGWNKIFSYLSEKGLCNEEKLSAFLNSSGIEPQEFNEHFNPNTYVPAVLSSGEDFSSALIRYISHIKLVYEPERNVEAKAYHAVRLFGKNSNSTDQISKLNREK